MTFRISARSGCGCRANAYDILGELISKEPLAPLVRDDDVHFFNMLRWTVSALIRAEELGIRSTNVEAMRESENPEVRRLLGEIPGNGKALGLRESWAADAIRLVGNYGEILRQTRRPRQPHRARPRPESSLD